jgi:hypothetical protein
MRTLVAAIVLAASVCALTGCAGEPETVYTGPGACITGEDEFDYVDCKDPDAEAVLVYRVSEGYDCLDSLDHIATQQYLDGQPIGMEVHWCVGNPGHLTGAQQAHLDEAKANWED